MPIQEKVQRKRPNNDTGGDSNEIEELNPELAETPDVEQVMRRLDNDLHYVDQLISHTQGRIDQRQQRGSRRKDNCSC